MKNCYVTKKNIPEKLRTVENFVKMKRNLQISPSTKVLDVGGTKTYYSILEDMISYLA